MNKKVFDVLRELSRASGVNDITGLAQVIGVTVFEIEDVILQLKKQEFIDEEYFISDKGLMALDSYKVDNAIILAAGMSTRFAPISYELPKGLISVKGEVLIERIIRQLQEAGIDEIIVVVGYMMEKFFYLKDKYNVKFVVNNEYKIKNTHSSIFAARDYLRNTYICCADNYYPENMFNSYEYQAFYSSIYLPGTSYVERAFTFDENGLITDTNKPSHDQWIMYGHAYFDRKFTNVFKPILESYYGQPGVENMYWETIYAENVKVLPMYIKKCKDTDILEFDSMEELRGYDSQYIFHNKIKIFENICKVLCCEITDIEDIEPIKEGLNNKSFKFLCNGKYYVYRHPGVNANIIDRRKEGTSLRAAKKIGIDETIIYVDEEEGWKISYYIDCSEKFDFKKEKHIILLANHLKKLHESNIFVNYEFNYFEEGNKLIEKVKCYDSLSFRKLENARNKILPIFELLKNDKWQVSLCHNDIYEPNLLVSEDKLNLIDWEFAGNSDIGFDICKLFTMSNLAYDELDRNLHWYFGRNTTDMEKKHLMACAAIIYYYWYVWAVYVSRNSEQVSEYLLVWYDKMNYYIKEVMLRN